jgi:hypothetical protein
VNAGVEEKGAEFLQVVVGVAAPEFVGPSTRGVIQMCHDGAGGVVDVDAAGWHVVSWGYFHEKESVGNH